jgi:S1-C subfamily serine protease
MRKLLLLVVCLFSFGCSSVEFKGVKTPPTMKIANPADSEAYKGETKPIFRIRAYEYMTEGAARYGSGTAFLVKHNDKLFMVTAFHVVDSSIIIQFYTHDRKPVQVKINDVFFLRHLDTALFEVAEISVKTTPYKLGKYRQGEKVTASGFPAAGDLENHEGVNYNSPVHTTATMKQGMSGGPVTDAEGNVIGINSAMVLSHPEIKGVFSRLEDVFYRVDRVETDK